jgi:hypothetical protein
MKASSVQVLYCAVQTLPAWRCALSFRVHRKAKFVSGEWTSLRLVQCRSCQNMVRLKESSSQRTLIHDRVTKGESSSGVQPDRSNSCMSRDVQDLELRKAMYTENKYEFVDFVSHLLNRMIQSVA